MNQPLPLPSLSAGSQTPNAALAAEITQALQQAGLINSNDQTLCERMLNGTVPADASAWQHLLEIALYPASSTPPDAF